MATTMTLLKTGKKPKHSPGKGKMPATGRTAIKRRPAGKLAEYKGITSPVKNKPKERKAVAKPKMKETKAAKSAKRLKRMDDIKLGKRAVSRNRSMKAKTAARVHGLKGKHKSAAHRAAIGRGVRRAHAAKKGLLKTEAQKGGKAYRKAVKTRGKRKMK